MEERSEIDVTKPEEDPFENFFSICARSRRHTAKDGVWRSKVEALVSRSARLHRLKAASAAETSASKGMAPRAFCTSAYSPRPLVPFIHSPPISDDLAPAGLLQLSPPWSCGEPSYCTPTSWRPRPSTSSNSARVTPRGGQHLHCTARQAIAARAREAMVREASVRNAVAREEGVAAPPHKLRWAAGEVEHVVRSSTPRGTSRGRLARLHPVEGLGERPRSTPYGTRPLVHEWPVPAPERRSIDLWFLPSF